MTKHGTVTFRGQSGTKYEFTAYSRDTSFSAVGAVYFMTKRTKKDEGGFEHVHIYVGETGDLSDRPLNHHRKACFDREGANCVCVYTESKKSERLKIETDLREFYDPSCNRE